MMNPNYIGTNIIGFEVFSAIIYIVEISFEDEGQRSTFFFLSYSCTRAIGDI